MKTYNFLMSRTYHTTLQVEAESEQEAREKLNKLDAYTIEMEQCCVVDEHIILESETKGEIFARICSVTGKGMWEGWVFGDGEAYAIDEESANKLARERGFNDIEEAFNADVCYFTTWWEDKAEESQYIIINGVVYDYENGEVGEVVA